MSQSSTSNHQVVQSPIKKTITNDDKKGRKRPGALLNQVKLSLHTIEAQVLFDGRYQKMPAGLLLFGGRMTELWYAAAHDDPYADQYLIKIEDTLTHCHQQLSELNQHYFSALSKVLLADSLSVSPLRSEAPFIASLRFTTPYGYQAAELLAQFDQLMCLMLTTQRIGLQLEPSYQQAKKSLGGAICQLLKLPFTWTHTKVSRADVSKQTELAQLAASKMDKLSPKVLTGEVRARLAPEIESTPLSRQTKIVKKAEV